LELNDGTIISCSADTTAKRWKIIRDSAEVQCVGRYEGHSKPVFCAVEKGNNNVLVTGSADETLKEWDIASCECIGSHSTQSGVTALIQTRDRSNIVCGLYNGTIEVRNTSELSVVVSQFCFHSIHAVWSLCELRDGTFVSGDQSGNLKRWKNDKEGGEEKVFQHFNGHGKRINQVIELRNDVILSASNDRKVMVWKIPPEEESSLCSPVLFPLIHISRVFGVVRLSEERFASVVEQSIRVHDFNEKARAEGAPLEVEHITTRVAMSAARRLRDGSILVASNSRFEITHHRLNQERLVNLCCAEIARNKGLFNVKELNEVLPAELFWLCFG